MGNAAALLPRGDVIVAGGNDLSRRFVSNSALASAERYDPSTATWRLAASMSVARANHTATLLMDGRVLVAGGDTLGSAELYVDSPASIGPGFTGTWYDPSQSGHGVLVQVLSDNRFLATWVTFSPEGTPAWFTGVGSYGGNVATITAVDQPTGGRWIPNFDPAQVAHNAWGTLTFTFTDCNHGRVDFNSVAGYGTGSMDLTRLTMPAGLSCQ
jgi:hypothetical protein